MNTFENLDNIFNVEATSIEKVDSDSNALTSKNEKPELQQDYEITRAQLHNLVMKGQEAIDGILDVARSSDHPRAYEVAGQLIKNVGDVAEKLIDLQKKMKDIEEKPRTAAPTTVNNTMFVGSTAELQKFIKQQNFSENK